MMKYLENIVDFLQSAGVELVSENDDGRLIQPQMKISFCKNSHTNSKKLKFQALGSGLTLKFAKKMKFLSM